MEKRQTVLVMAERSAEITAQLAARFGSRCELLFAENEPDFGAALSRADAIIGEPEEVQLQNARALSWLQLTWAGADKYARMARFPAGVTLCNVSGAFGTVISEYVLGSIVALYRALPVYWSQQKAHVWQQHAKGSTICGAPSTSGPAKARRRSRAHWRVRQPMCGNAETRSCWRRFLPGP